MVETQLIDRKEVVESLDKYLEDLEKGELTGLIIAAD